MTPAFCSDGSPNVLVHFFYLQVLDMLTTMVFLANGVGEANPLVRLLFTALHSPLGGLLAVKALAATFAAFCCFCGRRQLLDRVNMGFAGLVVWNLIAMIVSKHAGA